MNTRLIAWSVFCLLVLGEAAPAGDGVKVFILAGQSNMEGKARNGLLEYQALQEETADFFAHLRRDGEWIRRDDVFIKFLDRRGKLTLGYGSPGRTGVELELGGVLGDAFEEPVLLIKTAWGGHSLFRDFRPPSAGVPEPRIEAELAKLIEKTRTSNEKHGRDDPLPTLEDVRSVYGRSYRNMLAEVQACLDELDTLFPELKGKTPAVSGFIWFQGWNDQYEGAEVEYASNMEHFIRDVRRDLETPELPFVIGVMGQNMSSPAKGAMLVIQEAQLSMEEVAGFEGNVRAVRTDTLVDEAAEALYPAWKENQEQWEQVGSDHAYHYLGSAIWFQRMGRAFGEAMLDLVQRGLRGR